MHSSFSTSFTVALVVIFVFLPQISFPAIEKLFSSYSCELSHFDWFGLFFHSLFYESCAQTCMITVNTPYQVNISWLNVKTSYLNLLLSLLSASSFTNVKTRKLMLEENLDSSSWRYIVPNISIPEVQKHFSLHCAWYCYKIGATYLIAYRFLVCSTSSSVNK